MKKCSVCKKKKSTSSFSSYWSNRYQKTFVRAHCDECKRSYTRAWRKRNPKKHTIHTSRWAKRNKNKQSAHQKVYRALLSGKLEKEPCEICGETKVFAHHEDYKKPLIVNWLCEKHHKKIQK